MTRDSVLVPLGDVLSITTGVLMSDRGIVGVRGLMAYLTGTSNTINDTSITHTGCMELAPHCRAELIRQHPWLAEISNDATMESLQQIIDKRPLVPVAQMQKH